MSAPSGPDVTTSFFQELIKLGYAHLQRAQPVLAAHYVSPDTLSPSLSRTCIPSPAYYSGHVRHPR